MVQHGHFHARVPRQYLGQLVTEGVVSYNDKSRESCAITVDWRNWVRPFSTKISYDPRIMVANASFSPMRTKNKLKLHWTMLVWKTIIYCSKLFFLRLCGSARVPQEFSTWDPTSNYIKSAPGVHFYCWFDLAFKRIIVEQNSLPTYIWRREITPPKWLRWQITA